jgi:hypothetical protein
MSDDVFLQLKKWCLEDRIFKLKLPEKEAYSWAFEVSYPFNNPMPVAISIMNEKNTDLVSIQLPIKMSPHHQEELKKKGPPAIPFFYNRLQTMFLQRDIAFSIDGNQHLWVIIEQIHFDGLSKHEFFKAIRHVHNTMILSNMILEEVIRTTTFMPVGKKGGGPGGKDAGETSGTFYQ